MAGYLKSRAEKSRVTVTAVESMRMQAIQMDRKQPREAGNSAGIGAGAAA
jgi:hypothetical protein